MTHAPPAPLDALAAPEGAESYAVAYKAALAAARRALSDGASDSAAESSARDAARDSLYPLAAQIARRAVKHAEDVGTAQENAR